LIDPGERDVGRAEYGEDCEDHPEGPGPTFSMEKTDPGCQPDEAEESKHSTNDDSYSTDQGSDCGKGREKG